MKLSEILIKSDNLSEHDVVYVKRPWSQNSDASVVRYKDGETVLRLMEEAPSFEYFLEAPLIKDIRQQVEKSGGSSEQILEIILYYAENDAFPP
jgi:hypothetical protein